MAGQWDSWGDWGKGDMYGKGYGMDWGKGYSGYGSYGSYSGGYDGGKGGKGDKDIKGLVRSIIQAQAVPDRASDESTIFVAGLPSDMTNLEMYQLFSAFGAIAPRGATALQDKETGKCTGIGFVNFLDVEAAQKAIRALNDFPFADGSWLTVKKKGPPKAKDGKGESKGKGEKGDKGKGKKNDKGK
ncbi:unnamed protein product [Effrenium voratum]|uniref:RRM domain-containing protein n=1 Tax=Effrenium voratum TaxID=2562239 RepID=A0AA36N1B8_9DINO|nr:unnamed protein product [Effrenium voratum]